MRVLIIKTSSMGDVIHTLPALTDAAKAFPGIIFDWVVEESFAEIPAWHPRVERVIPMAWRRWRKNLFSANTRREFKQFCVTLREYKYDLIIDAQGLVKSSVFACLARGKRAGLDWRSARESLASIFYQKKCTVNFYQHAVVRMRLLFSELLGYSLPDTVPDYGVDRQQFQHGLLPENYLVFLHGTTWTTKLWPESHWVALAKIAQQHGLEVKMTCGNDVEEERANRMAAQCSNVKIFPRLTIQQAAKLLADAKAVVSVDTGFGHLAAALAVPGVSIYGPTNPEFTGAMGKDQIHLAASFSCSPCLQRNCTYVGDAEVAPACFATIPPAQVWFFLEKLLAARGI